MLFYDIRKEYKKAKQKEKRRGGGGVVEGVGALDNIKKKEVVFNVLCRTLTLGN